MEKDTYEELQKKLADSEAKNKRLEAQLEQFRKAEDVMVAAGIVSKEKVEQAHEIVRSFAKQ